MTSDENIGTWVTSEAAMQAASSVSGEAGSSGGGAEAPYDGEEAGPSGVEGSRPSDGGGAGMSGSTEGAGPSGGGSSRPNDGGGAGMGWNEGAGPSWAGGAGPSWAGGAGPSWAGGAGPSWAGEAGPSGGGGRIMPARRRWGRYKISRRNRPELGRRSRPERKGGSRPRGGGGAGMSSNSTAGDGPSWAGGAGPSGSGVPSQYARGERKNKPENRQCRRKRQSNSTGEGTVKKIKRGVAGSNKTKEVEDWDNEKSVTFYHTLYENRKLNNEDRVPKNPPRSCRRALKRKSDHKEVPFTESVLIPDNTMPPQPNSDAQNAETQKETLAGLNLENPDQANDTTMAELLLGMSIGSPGNDNTIVNVRRSKYNHRRVVWWTTTNWADVRKGAAQYKDAIIAKVVQNKATSTESSAGHSVPEAPNADRPNEPVVFNRQDAINAAAARARILRRAAPRRQAISESGIDAEQAQQELDDLLVFRREEDLLSSGTEDSSSSSLFSSGDSSSEDSD